MGHDHDQDHHVDHGHGDESGHGHHKTEHEHEHPRGWWNRIRNALTHSHDHGDGPLPEDTGAEGIRASQMSLLGLGVTAAVQAGLVVFTGSVALLSDTLHNLTDALTAIPLWIAFSLGRRQRTQRHTFGLNRAEDLAGLFILGAIAVSAIGVTWESVRRLIDPRAIDHAVWVVAAGMIGALGNELVARYRIRVGRRISSAALIADGQHARADALTSLAVVAAGVGALIGADWIDPVAGLAVATMMLAMLRRSAGRIFGRLLDAVDPELVDRAEATARAVPGVAEVDDIRMRWHGHRVLITMVVAVDPEVTVREGHRIAQNVTHELMHAFPFVVDSLVHVDPSGDHEAHLITAHHRQ